MYAIRSYYADQVFVEALHVVYVQAHHVADAAREEERVRALLDGLVRIALHQAEILQTIDEEFRGQPVDVRNNFV